MRTFYRGSVPLFAWSVIAILASACGSELPKPGNNANGADQTFAVSDVTPPPGEYFAAAMSEQLDMVFGGKDVAPNGNAIKIGLNFSGAAVKKGFGRGQSFLLCSEQAAVPAANLTSEQRDKILYYVTEYFKKLNPEIKVSLASASSPNVVHVGGNPASIGCTGANIKFRAPLDSGNVVSNDVAFVFSDVAADQSDLVTQIENAIEAFVDPTAEEATALADSVPVVEGVPGAKEINSMGRMLMEIDTNAIVDVTPLQPELEKLIPGGARYISDFDKIISVSIGAGSQSKSNAGSTGSKPAAGGLSSWMDQLMGGASSGGSNSSGAADMISTVAVLSGHPEIAIAAQVLGPMLSSGAAAGGTANTAKNTSNKALVPDYASVISVKQQQDLRVLFEAMRKHKSFVDENYDIDTANALSAMLVVAFSQAFHVTVAVDTAESK